MPGRHLLVHLHPRATKHMRHQEYRKHGLQGAIGRKLLPQLAVTIPAALPGVLPLGSGKSCASDVATAIMPTCSNQQTMPCHGKIPRLKTETAVTC